MKNLLTRLLVAALAFASCAVFHGCTSNGTDVKPEIHGKMGVQVESQNSRRFRPVP